MSQFVSSMFMWYVAILVISILGKWFFELFE